MVEGQVQVASEEKVGYTIRAGGFHVTHLWFRQWNFELDGHVNKMMTQPANEIYDSQGRRRTIGETHNGLYKAAMELRTNDPEAFEALLDDAQLLLNGLLDLEC